MIKFIKNSFTRGQLIFGWARTVGIVYGYTVFSDRISWSYNRKQTYGVLQTGSSVFELFYEWTTTKKMKDPWSS